MTQPQRQIDDLEDQASERELVRLLSADQATRLKSESRAVELRNRIATLKARLAKLSFAHPKSRCAPQ